MVFVLAVTAYLFAAFLLSALVVRISPRSRVSRNLRLKLGLFPLLPLLLVRQALSGGSRHRREGPSWWHALRTLFARLSGHRNYVRYPDQYYNYRPHEPDMCEPAE